MCHLMKCKSIPLKKKSFKEANQLSKSLNFSWPKIILYAMFD